MSEEEVAKFEADPYFKDIIKVRAWDELAKVENKPLPDLERYKKMAKDHLRNIGRSWLCTKVHTSRRMLRVF